MDRNSVDRAGASRMPVIDKNFAKLRLKKLNSTIYCHLNLRDAGNHHTLKKISLYRPVKIPIISTLDIFSVK